MAKGRPPRILVATAFPLLILVACGSAAKPGVGADGGNGAADGASFDSGGASGDGASGDAAEAGPAPMADPCIEAGTCPVGQWIDVTPSDMNPKVLSPPTSPSDNSAFGPGAVVGDPSRPTDLYIAEGGAGLWKSTDYGSHWTNINPSIGYSPIGIPIAVAGTTPATIWLSQGQGNGTVLKSTDGGQSFQTIPQSLAADLYSIEVDPNDTTHLISGLHEVDGLVESIDGGTTWRTVGGSGWPTGGISFYPFFIDTGNAATTRTTWFAIAQDGATPVITSDGGASWTSPNGLSGLQHPHGSARLDQRGSTLFVAGIEGPGQGVYRSTDMGANSLGTLPSALPIGPNSIVVTNDGSHSIVVGAMWAAGIWIYVEP